jgi:NTE family protein
MLLALAKQGVKADFVVGSSVGAMNAAYYAADPSVEHVEKLVDIWKKIRREDIFPITFATLASFVWRRDFLVRHEGVRRLIRTHLPYQRLEQAKIPVHVVTTDVLTGETVTLSHGSAEDAIVATTAIPGVFPPLRQGERFLSDGAVSSNTPVRIALSKGAMNLVVLPTGYACANRDPPMGAIANALHALTLLIARQLTEELESVPDHIHCSVVPPLCPLSGSPYDFSMTAAHITRAFDHATEWIKSGGLNRSDIPDTVRPHRHFEHSEAHRPALDID